MAIPDELERLSLGNNRVRLDVDGELTGHELPFLDHALITLDTDDLQGICVVVRQDFTDADDIGAMVAFLFHCRCYTFGCFRCTDDSHACWQEINSMR